MTASASAKPRWTGIARMLSVVLALVARLAIPGLPDGAWAAPVAAASLPDGWVICHADGGGSPTEPARPAGHAHECLVCPACNLTGQAALLPPGPVPLPALRAVAALHMALPPPATGPPHPARVAARPTGPPAHPV